MRTISVLDDVPARRSDQTAQAGHTADRTIQGSHQTYTKCQRSMTHPMHFVACLYGGSVCISIGSPYTYVLSSFLYCVFSEGWRCVQSYPLRIISVTNTSPSRQSALCRWGSSYRGPLYLCLTLGGLWLSGSASSRARPHRTAPPTGLRPGTW